MRSPRRLADLLDGTDLDWNEDSVMWEELRFIEATCDYEVHLGFCFRDPIF